MIVTCSGTTSTTLIYQIPLSEVHFFLRKHLENTENEGEINITLSDDLSECCSLFTHLDRQETELFLEHRDGKEVCHGEHDLATCDALDAIDKRGVIDELRGWVDGLWRWRANPPIPVMIDARLCIVQHATAATKRTILSRRRPYLTAMPQELIANVIPQVTSSLVGDVTIGRALAAIRSSSRQLRDAADGCWQEALLPLRSPPNLLEVYVGSIGYDLGNVPRFAKLASPMYMSKHKDINSKMRVILINWLIDVHDKFRLQLETLHLAISLLDRFLEKHTAILRGKLQLAGVTAVWIASKIVEIYPPEVRDFHYITDRAYTIKEITAYEAQILQTMGWEAQSAPSTLLCLSILLQVEEASTSAERKQLEHLAHYLIELTLQEYAMLAFLPPTIAAAAVYLARKTLDRAPWPPELAQRTCCTEATIMPCVRELHALQKGAPQNEFRAVWKKYQQRKFSWVSNIAPASLCTTGA